MIDANAKSNWVFLEHLENTAISRLANMLKPFSRSVAYCYECFVEIPALPRKHKLEREYVKQIATAGIFSQITLTNLRAIWKLLHLGYTLQAGALAASSFESALTVTYIAVDPSKADVFRRSKTGDIPWKVEEMCKNYAKWSIEKDYEELGIAFTKEEIDIYWRQWYAMYEWLCRMKHPYIPAALHYAVSRPITKEAIELLSIYPDVREDDFSNKVTVLRNTIVVTMAALVSFASMHYLDEKTPQALAWKNKLEAILPDIDKATEPLVGKKLCIQIGDTRKSRDFFRLRQLYDKKEK